MKDQALSIKQMQHLKELGVDTSKGSAYWHRVVRMNTNEVVTNWFVSFSEPSQCLATMKVETISTFTFQDIWDLLPKELDLEPFAHKWYLSVDYQHNRMTYAYFHKRGVYYLTDPTFNISGQAILDVAYKMLCWCIKNGYIETKKG